MDLDVLAVSRFEVVAREEDWQLVGELVHGEPRLEEATDLVVAGTEEGQHGNCIYAVQALANYTLFSEGVFFY